MEPLESRRLLAVLSVTNVSDLSNGNVASIDDLIANDGGDGISLREAIVAANATPNVGDVDRIEFNIPGVGPHVIELAAALPDISDAVTIDGFTQTGASPNAAALDAAIDAVLQIEIDGRTIGGNADGFTVAAAGSTLRGLAVFGFQGEGVSVEAGQTVLEGTFIGIRADGVTAVANAGRGVRIINVPDNRIGGSDPAARNLISGNALSGIEIVGPLAANNAVLGNFIGVTRSGASAAANSGSGVFVSGSPDNVIGGVGTGEGNLVSGNLERGVRIQGALATRTQVLGNRIGVDVGGTTALPNQQAGVTLLDAPDNRIGGSAAGAGNVISGNGTRGLEISGAAATNNVVLGNWIGLDASGVVAIGNASSGILVDGAPNGTIGSLAAGEANHISANGGDGVEINGAGAIGIAVRGNEIYRNVGLGIELASGTGLTPNDAGDADNGPNRLQNFPAVAGDVEISGNQAAVTYQVPTLPANATFPLNIDFYMVDADGQEGRVYLGSDVYAASDVGSDKVATLAVTTGLTNSQIVAMATDAAGNSSEFSPAANVVLAPDRLEANDTPATATFLGSPLTAVEADLTIHQASDVDVFRYTAHETGLLIVRIAFPHSEGDLTLEAIDVDGNVLVSVDASSTSQNFEELYLPTVAHEPYFIRVASAGGEVNSYDLEVENFAAPVPTAIWLDASSDLGRSQTDGVTSDLTPTFVVQADVLGLIDANRNLLADVAELPALTAAQATAGDVAGVAVEVTLFNLDAPAQAPVRFFLDPVSTQSPFIYQGTSPETLPRETYLASARTVVIDRQSTHEVGRGGASSPFRVVLDDVPPIATFGSATIDGDGLAAGSDSGATGDATTLTDRVTNDAHPTLYGVAEANSIVRVYVRDAADQRVLVGETVAVPFSGDNPLATGQWTLTPVVDLMASSLGFDADTGLRRLEVEAVDLAGNVSRGAEFAFPATPAAITDNAASSFVINVDNYDEPIRDVDVHVSVTHAFDGELTLRLTSPAGTTIVLAAAVGADGDDFSGTIFDDEAIDAIGVGVPPFAGRFQPQEPLTTLDGESPNGNWTLEIIDSAAGNVGTLLDWRLSFASELDLVVDVQGPQVTDVSPATTAGYSLLGTKTALDGPTPLVDALTIYFLDGPQRVDQAAPFGDFIYPALGPAAALTSSYQVTGDGTGTVRIVAVEVDHAVKIAASVTTSIDATAFASTTLIGLPAEDAP
ncbi:MAG: proprotein convertase P-domain-containing protein, partial [Planctomycetales bacterium]|nr:proprotein convertase P-domain-containing protein [Planctomycetales bacterium]